jgi:3-mercaptopyruvate sulfurtransferase SseA
MRFVARVVILLFVAAVAAAVTNAVRPDRIGWVVSHDEVYPPPTREEVAAGIKREAILAAIDQGAIVIDARTEEKYRNGHIPTAHNLPAHSVQENLGTVYQWVSTPNDFLIVYCGGGECDESSEVFKLLKASGFTNLHLYFGGWEDWTKAGLLVEEGTRD